MQIKITDITPFMKKGWVAMDKSGAYRWFLRKPYANKDYGVFRTDISCQTCSLRCFDITPVDDWTKSLIKIDNTTREKFEEEYQNNIQKTIQELNQND